jgi:hypothetical protein
MRMFKWICGAAICGRWKVKGAEKENCVWAVVIRGGLRCFGLMHGERKDN